MVALGTVGWVTGCLLPVQEPRVLGFVNSWAVFMTFLPYKCVALSYIQSTCFQWLPSILLWPRTLDKQLVIIGGKIKSK